jgi:hypothetical protein
MKPRKGMKMTSAQRTKLLKALTDLQVHYGAVAEVWNQLPAEQRKAVLEKSPVLAQFLNFFAMFGGNNAA